MTSFQSALDGLKQERDAANVSAYDRILGLYVPSDRPVPAPGT